MNKTERSETVWINSWNDYEPHDICSLNFARFGLFAAMKFIFHGVLQQYVRILTENDVIELTIVSLVEWNLHFIWLNYIRIW